MTIRSFGRFLTRGSLRRLLEMLWARNSRATFSRSWEVVISKDFQ
ncbi:hypothetical protein Goarm_000332 [Gossypium armourianum]|uniref:Uncharacterized protein n=3 Tax=Gossypium TaxID=3633 RepID=A0A7J8QKX1_GOSRA|nr:hypothetical protein [Gossypium lobatum]MBA0602219.1 hypothetical protein [Gossypium raimondii]MBA0843118.1 hypothetical protein [Gossypium armourianum]